jgi:hypothetical protein
MIVSSRFHQGPKMKMDVIHEVYLDKLDILGSSLSMYNT